MRTLILTLTLLAATPACAQTDKTKQELLTQLDRVVCPVDMTAQQQGSPAAIWTTSLEDQHRSPAELKTLRTGVHVNLKAPQKEIKQAEIAVFFLPPGARVQPVTGSQFASSPTAAREKHKSFSLVSGKTTSLQLGGDLLLGPIASVTHINLLHVIYSDGTEWKAHNSDTCSVKPSLYMPVDAK